MMAALFVYHRAKLGYGLLSGEYSKPAPDPGEENGASEPRVRRNTVIMDLQLSGLTHFHGTCGIYSHKLVRMRSNWYFSHLWQIICSCMFAGRPSWHSTKNVQSTCWARSSWVLHQSTTGCSRVFIALHKHGGGKETISFCLSVWSSSFFPYCTLLFVYTHRGIVALGPTHLKPSGSWWRSGLCVSNHRKPSTHSGWITSSSCQSQWTRLQTQVKG